MEGLTPGALKLYRAWGQAYFSWISITNIIYDSLPVILLYNYLNFIRFSEDSTILNLTR